MWAATSPEELTVCKRFPGRLRRQAQYFELSLNKPKSRLVEIRIVPVSLVLVSLHLAVFLGDTADVLS